jgi:hypothetical protein
VKGCLAHSWLTAEHKHAASSRTGFIEQPVQRPAFALARVQCRQLTHAAHDAVAIRMTASGLPVTTPDATTVVIARG